MTDERRKYLASISKEEYFIREEIKGCKHLIRVLKDCIGIASCESVANLHKRDISKYKTLIKSLKKQLPAPMRLHYDYFRDNEMWLECRCCKNHVCKTQLYCEKCGQKLR